MSSGVTHRRESREITNQKDSGLVCGLVVNGARSHIANYVVESGPGWWLEQAEHVCMHAPDPGSVEKWRRRNCDITNPIRGYFLPLSLSLSLLRAHGRSSNNLKRKKKI